MSAFLPEPSFRHDSPARLGVLLINLGTPAAPTARALRPYLKQFLSDRRVVELPRWLWALILNGVILNVRPRKSAEKYASIWTPQGSPLLVNTRSQAEGLASRLAGEHVVVEFAMRYGQPSVEQGVQKLRAQGVERLLLLPLYPQYAASSSGSALDAAFAALMKLRNMPEVRTVRHYHDHPAYIAALAAQVEAHWRQHGRGEKLLMSFHGVPRYTLDKGDPYPCECHKTGRLLAEALGLAASDYVVCFQSRFGRTEWVKPYTSDVLRELGRQKVGKLDVICPGFIADCLETLEEIAMEGKETFLTAGGGDYRYIPCLNASPVWIDALAQISREQLAGWLTPEAEDLPARKTRALAMGARA